MGQRVTAQVQRVSQTELVINNLEAGISPAMVTGLAAVFAQLQSQEQVPMLTISITASIPGYQRSLFFGNGVWSGYDLTHHFYDDRSSLSYGPPHNRKEQGQSLQLPSNPLPPPHSNVPWYQHHANPVLRVSLGPRAQVRAPLYLTCPTCHLHRLLSRPCSQPCRLLLTTSHALTTSNS